MADRRVLVTGSRDWTELRVVFEALDRALAEHAWAQKQSDPDNRDDWTVTVVHGACRSGADALAREWYVKRKMLWHHHVREDPHPANWKLGKSAGFRRNEEMVALGADLALVFALPCAKASCRGRAPHDTHGTAQCAQAARKAGIEVRRFDG